MACSGFDLEGVLGVRQGNYYELIINVADYNGIPIDLTNYSGYAPITSNYGSQSTVGQFNISFINATSGIMKLFLYANETAALPVSELVYELEIYPTGSTQLATKYLAGYLEVCPQVSI